MAPKEKVEWVQLFIFLSINVSYKYKLSTYMSSYTAKLNGHPHDCTLYKYTIYSYLIGFSSGYTSSHARDMWTEVNKERVYSHKSILYTIIINSNKNILR